MKAILNGKRNWLPFATGYVLSAFGYEFIFFVMTIYIFNLTKNALNISIFTALLAVTKIFLPLCGTITDRYKKENSFGMAALLAGVCICVLFFVENIMAIYFLWFLISFFFTFISNVRTALMTEVMPEESYLKGNSIVFILLNIAKITSPLIGGILAGSFNPKILFLLTALIYFLAAAASRLIKLTEGCHVQQEKTTTIDRVKKAFKFMKANRNLRTLSFLLFSRGLFLGYQVTLFVTYIRSYLLLGNKEYGLFLTSAGIGSIVGSMLGPAVSKRLDKYFIIWTGLTLHYLTFIALGFMKDFHWALVIIFISFILFYITSVAVHSLRDSSTQSQIRGTVYGSITAINTPLSVISMIVGGYCINSYGAPKMLIIYGFTAIIGLCSIGFAFKGSRIEKKACDV